MTGEDDEPEVEETKLLPKGRLNIDDATSIKAALWEGERQATIASEYGISQGTVSHIYRGTRWGNAPWPDGTTGAIAYDQHILLHSEKYNVPKTPIPDHVKVKSKASKIADEIADAVQDEIDQSDEALKEAMQMAGKVSSDEEEKKPEWDTLDWDIILKHGKALSFVKEAEKDEKLKLAVQITLRKTPPRRWNEGLREEIDRIKEML